jgi:subtilisin family serine protease
MSGSGYRPAFSEAFKPDSLAILNPISPIEDVSEEWAWGNARGRGVRVGIVDSGVEEGHPMVGPVDGWLAASMAAGDVRLSSEPHEDAMGHGTACAGIVRSHAPDCELYSIRVLGPGASTGEAFIAGLRWAIENGMHVCNLSLGTTKKAYYAALHELADLAYFRNVILVTAANNFPISSFPCEYASVISVAAHEGPDPETYYYNPMPPVEFGAPGINVRVAWRGGGTSLVTGNSFAAPHVTGFVARLLEKHPGLTSFQVKSVLRALAANMRREEL